MYRRLIRDQQLFTFLELATETTEALPRTTSALEGGVNKPIKDLLRAHRGMPEHHATRAVEWLLTSLTEHAHDPWDLVAPEHWAPPRPTPVVADEPIGPALYDTAYSPEDGNGIHHGWAGRSRL